MNNINIHSNQATEHPLTVVIVEDDKKLRDTYAEIINNGTGISCVGSFGDCESLLEKLDDVLPNVVLMDIGLPGMSGIEGTQQIKSRSPSIDVVMLTVYEDDDKIFQSICSGASGYVLKNSKPSELVNSIKAIRTGAPMTASIARRVLGMVRGTQPAVTNNFDLTVREKEILQLLVDGHSDRMIGEKLFISPHTVNSHLKRIYEKLQVHSKSQAVSTALKHRLV